MLKICTTENLTHFEGRGIFAAQTKKLIAMKKFFLIIVIALTTFSAHAQVKRLNPFLSTTTYNVPGQTPYVENALAFECKSVTYKEFQPGKFKATLEIVTAFRKGEETTFSKVSLDSPIVTDTANLSGAFVDQQRFPLSNGEYVMEIIVTDKGSDRAPVFPTSCCSTATAKPRRLRPAPRAVMTLCRVCSRFIARIPTN